MEFKLTKIEPFVKWVGGKRKLLPSIFPLLPDEIDHYVEPFVGGGALYFALGAKHNLINDSNEELINAFIVVRDQVEDLLDVLDTFVNSEEEFMKIRAWDRDPEFLTKYSAVERAARFIYLNRTCYNGMYRTSNKGFYNVPYGKNPDRPVYLEEKMLEASVYLSRSNTEILCTDYYELLDRISPDCFVYLDPPYVPISATSYFTSYTTDKWQRVGTTARLGQFCDLLTLKGVPFILSNSHAAEVTQIFGKYHFYPVYARRVINSKGDARSAVKEYLITNYKLVSGRCVVDIEVNEQPEQRMRRRRTSRTKKPAAGT